MTSVINISDLATEPKVAIVTPDGARHEMKTASLKSFIENVRLIEAMGTNASVAEEMEVMISITLSAFPSLGRAELVEWPVDVLEKLSDLARGRNGEVVSSDESENPSSGNV
jgi:hypothetical protein